MNVRIKKQVIYVFEADESVDRESRIDAIEETIIALEGERPDIAETKTNEIIAIVSQEGDTQIPGEGFESLLAMLRDREVEINRVQEFLEKEQEEEEEKGG